MQLFRPKAPTIPEAPKAPTIDDAAQAEEDIARLRRRRGLASTFLVGQERQRSAAADALTSAGTSPTLGAVPVRSGGPVTGRERML